MRFQPITTCGWVRVSTRVSAGVAFALLAWDAVGTPPSTPFAVASGGATLFEPVPPDKAGIRFRADPGEAAGQPYMQNGGGIAVADVDGDGLVDVYLVSPRGENRLFRRTGSWKFEEITASAGVAAAAGLKTGAVFADFDNDGRADLYVCRFDLPDLLFMNQGGGRFSEESADRGIREAAPSTMVYPSDFDRDGDLDLFVTTHRRVPQGTGTAEVAALDRSGVVLESGVPDLFYVNDGSGRFTERASEIGLGGSRWNSLAALWLDLNGDLWPDLYVGNAMNGPDLCYLNKGGGRMEEVSPSPFSSSTYQTGGLDVADFDRDGIVDLVAADTEGETHEARALSEPSAAQLRWMWKESVPPQKRHNMLHLNTGAGRFVETAFYAGVARTGATRPVRCVDLDLDGREDLLFARWSHPDGSGPGSLLAFRNRPDGTFEEMTAAAGLAGVAGVTTIALADLDDDGDADLVCNRYSGPPLLFRNQSTGKGRFGFRLEGTRSNRGGLGAELELRAGDRIAKRWVSASRGYLSAELGPVLVALGPGTGTASLRIRWPSGTVQEIEGLEPEHLHIIREASGTDAPGSAENLYARLTPETRFRDAGAELGLVHVHRNDAPDETRSQPLLPSPLSHLGPAVAVGDANGDGRMDLAVGGGEMHEAALFLQGEDGRFARAASSALLLDSQCIDMGLVWADFDGDGDRDLYAASGGLQSSSGFLRDRLYLNDGTGVLDSAPADHLVGEPVSSSVVAAADMDRDGDLDYFVGSRVSPKRYPESPASRILINAGGRLEDATPLAGPELMEAGMVTAALWCDLDTDGYPDLVVASEWGRVRVFRNAAGTLVQETEERIPDSPVGRWSCLAAGDFNNDGAIDLVAGNRGLNVPENTGGVAASVLMAGEWQGSSRSLSLLQGMKEGGRVVPVLPRGLLAQALPGLSGALDDSRSFGSATLESLLRGKEARTLHHLEADESRSLLLLNDGKGRFRATPLPSVVQLAPATAFAVEDFDADGNLDLFVGQNIESPVPGQDPTNNGPGLLLLGDGRGGFRPLPPAVSGVLCPVPVRSAAVIDLAQDGWPDLVVGVESGPLLLLRNAARDRRPAPPLRIRLAGPPGNPDAIGARLVARTRAGRTLVREIRAGDGGLSQSEPSAGIEPGPRDSAASLEVFWPDGKSSRHHPPFPQPPARLHPPADAPRTTATTHDR